MGFPSQQHSENRLGIACCFLLARCHFLHAKMRSDQRTGILAGWNLLHQILLGAFSFPSVSLRHPLTFLIVFVEMQLNKRKHKIIANIFLGTRGCRGHVPQFSTNVYIEFPFYVTWLPLFISEAAS